MNKQRRTFSPHMSRLPQPQCRTLLLLVVLMVCCTTLLRATPTTAEQASFVVRHWLAQDPTPLQSAMNQTIANVATYYENGTVPLYYAVALSTAASSSSPPMIGSSRSSRLLPRDAMIHLPNSRWVCW